MLQKKKKLMISASTISAVFGLGILKNYEPELSYILLELFNKRIGCLRIVLSYIKIILV